VKPKAKTRYGIAYDAKAGAYYVFDDVARHRLSVQPRDHRVRMSTHPVKEGNSEDRQAIQAAIDSELALRRKGKSKMTSLRAISIRPEFAGRIRDGKKKIEYRSWPTSHRGPLLIVSSLRPPHRSCPSGQAVCIVNLTDCVHNVKEDDYEWKLASATPIAPFPVKGQLRLYDVKHASLRASLRKMKRTPPKSRRSSRGRSQ
jgi:hypothetical protein